MAASEQKRAPRPHRINRHIEGRVSRLRPAFRLALRNFLAVTVNLIIIYCSRRRRDEYALVMDGRRIYISKPNIIASRLVVDEEKISERLRNKSETIG